MVVGGGVLHNNDNADVTSQGRLDFVALGLKTLKNCVTFQTRCDDELPHNLQHNLSRYDCQASEQFLCVEKLK